MSSLSQIFQPEASEPVKIIEEFNHASHFKGLRFDPARHDTLGRSVNSLAKSNLMQLIGETF